MADIATIGHQPIETAGMARADGVRAGPWLFFTGHLAARLDEGVAPEVIGSQALPFHAAPRHRREGDFILRRLADLLQANGSRLSNVVRLDQYYPSAGAVDGYHLARKALFGSYIPPSTSVLMDDLLVPGCSIDVSLVAVTDASGMAPKRIDPEGVPVPAPSGFAPTVIAGDYVFVAGQMANSDTMDGMHPDASRPKNALWHGTDIRLQTEFLITSRLAPALEAAGSSLGNSVKAQIYLSDINGTADWLDVWNAHFRTAPCAVSVIPSTGFGFADGLIEINLLALRDGGDTRKEIIEADIPTGMAFGPAAVRAGSLLCLSGLVAAGEDGPTVDPRFNAELRHLGVGARRQVEAILAAAERICGAAGTTLSNTVRAQHFLTDLADFIPALSPWRNSYDRSALPVGAVGVKGPMPVPGCTVMLDLWVYMPDT